MSCAIWLVLAVMPLAVIGGCSRNPATGEMELILINQEEEIAIGNEAAPEFEQQFGGKVPDERLQRYVSDVGGKMAKVAERPMPYEYAVLASEVPNAFALPGGKIYITAGLMKIMENERELAAVLGHETGHVSAKHNVKMLQRQVGGALLVQIAGAAIGGTAGAVAEGVGKVVTAVANLRYSRDQEYQADLLGLRYMTRAEYNPYGMIELLDALMAQTGEKGSGLGEMFRTHPLTTKRIEEVREIIQTRYGSYSPDTPDPRAAEFRRMREIAVKHTKPAPKR